MLVVLVVLMIIQYALPAHSKVVSFYDAYIFHPFQSFRNIVFSIIPFSVGDLLYIIGAIALFLLLIRWIYFTIRFKTHKHYLAESLLRTSITVGIIYILFLLGWGGNYYKSSLSAYWQLDKSEWSDSSLQEFDVYLIGKLNDYAPGYRDLPFREINRNARDYYKKQTDGNTRTDGIKAKPSVFGFLMQHFAIQGYYNPFTGEAQVNKYLPSFMLPFVVCHEMAHQSGIAAEDDANLLSYALSTSVNDSCFKYSAYFNLWLYTHARLRAKDPALAHQLARELNPVSAQHIETLRQIRKKYQSGLSDYSGLLYDEYLKMFHQKDGIESYNRVAITAWELERQREKQKQLVIRIP